MVIRIQLFMAGFWRGHTTGVDDDGYSKTPPFRPKKKGSALPMFFVASAFFI